MLLKSLVFVLIVYGLAMVIALSVAAIVKAIALVVQRRKVNATADKPKA